MLSSISHVYSSATGHNFTISDYDVVSPFVAHLSESLVWLQTNQRLLFVEKCTLICALWIIKDFKNSNVSPAFVNKCVLFGFVVDSVHFFCFQTYIHSLNLNKLDQISVYIRSHCSLHSGCSFLKTTLVNYSVNCQACLYVKSTCYTVPSKAPYASRFLHSNLNNFSIEPPPMQFHSSCSTLYNQDLSLQLLPSPHFQYIVNHLLTCHKTYEKM